ncbi:hypothetical protein PTSG_07113 [Salpingoeca rosetta]|uniref:Uncharacterized protein n=1 Tax=Salpingoeca rosetta (strain ATCC 50818 / BSB-021) TaxID=946362 RepID=F2UE35_SALR5|nr:uncharacterized protein PTSG_07113 [Salpingoeca rosetta]EGD74885.1 hypothetical protein PTSG_07113 [Salpingoeca rosetta]|eukprot:XP_004992530.1 hypothetical protein PTSG_07113 [Salpingoeca rosetta]
MTASREEKLAQLRAAREKGGSAEDVKSKNQAALQNLKAKRVEEFTNQAEMAGMDLSGLDPSIAQFLGKGMSAEEMIAARSAKRADGAAKRGAAPPPPPKK